MPSNNVKEKKVMEVGSLVETTDKIFTMPAHEQSTESIHDVLERGTVGIVIERPYKDRPRQYKINFVGGQTYWMFHGEIRPYMGEKNV